MPLYIDGSLDLTGAQNGGPKPLLGLDHLTAFRDVLYTLEQEFEFIILDLPSVGRQEIPILFTNQLHGLVVVVNAQQTKKEDLDALFRKITSNQVLGFVMNRSDNANT